MVCFRRAVPRQSDTKKKNSPIDGSVRGKEDAPEL